MPELVILVLDGVIEGLNVTLGRIGLVVVPGLDALFTVTISVALVLVKTVGVGGTFVDILLTMVVCVSLVVSVTSCEVRVVVDAP